MATETTEKKSRLIAALREGVSLVQMMLFKEIRANLTQKSPNEDPVHISMLAGSVTNEVFGTLNPEMKFVNFRKKNWGVIEQEVLSIKTNIPNLCPKITDALRIQTLCDHQEGEDSSQTLARAKEFGFLLEEREIPLPSTFMTIIRELGAKHNLIYPPVEITPEEDQSIVH
jgi:hypothetical protein